MFELPAPYVSSTQWCVVNRKNGELLFGKRETESRQVASLTKIMSSLVVLDLIDKYENVSQFVSLNRSVRIPLSASELCGTTA